MLLLVGAYFALISFYNEFGLSRDVFWNSYIKIVRQGFIFIVLFKSLSVLPNIISILSCLGGMAYSSGLTVFRLWAAYMSNGVYESYFEYMKNGDIRNYCTFWLFIIMITIHFISYPEPIIKYLINPLKKCVLNPIKKLISWKSGSQTT